MNHMIPRTLLILILVVSVSCSAGKALNENDVIPAAERTEAYFPFLEGKRVALVANQTSLVGKVHLADTLVSAGIRLNRIFSPEHGFRGNASAGQEVADSTDQKTGLPVVSLYGSQKKPLPGDLADVDVVIFDIQDAGVRFYTYISTMHYVMEACAENNKPLIVLDRPDPNGNYVDGPVLEDKFASFVGMDPVPVVYGMTIGEYALMINGEGWLNSGKRCELTVIPCLNYNHRTVYAPPVPPSPNLPNLQSIRLYPSLALFEGTNVSVGRGTSFPFQVFGSPGITTGNFTFTPESRPGAALHPPYEDAVCRGKDLRRYSPPGGNWDSLNLSWLIWAYKHTTDREAFFNAYFSKLAGTEKLQKQIENGIPEADIRASWQPGLEKFLGIRHRYLLYD
jgi:uncharacterized protein YbbC (DUF1343 family)